MTTLVKVAHVRLCHSRMPFVRAYPRESQEMVFDAHDRAFAFYRGACARGIYDNMKTAVENVFVGKDRAFNRRFLRMCSHYLVEPTACNAWGRLGEGAGGEPGGAGARALLYPRLRFRTYEEMNGWLIDQCVAYAKAHPHPECRDQTIWSVFEAERRKPDWLCRAVRRVPRCPGRGLKDLSRPFRQQQILGQRPRRWAAQSRCTLTPTGL